MAGLIYGLCAVTALVCAWLLLRAYARSRYRLLLWSGLCFACLTASNVLLVIDRLVFTTLDMSTWRLAPSLVGMMLLLYGLIWDVE